MMKRTISGMIGAGSLAHNRRDFVAENVDPKKTQYNICYRNENLQEVYKELFDEAVERYNVGKRNDRKITNYYEKIRLGKQEKLFHEVIFQIGNCGDMAVGTEEILNATVTMSVIPARVIMVLNTLTIACFAMLS